MTSIGIHLFKLKFKRPAITSRDTLLEKQCYILTYGEPLKAVAECNFFQGLSADNPLNYQEVLAEACKKLEGIFSSVDSLEDERFSTLVLELQEYPSIQFGIEQLWHSFHGETPFRESL
jgi:hypothetical protein